MGLGVGSAYGETSSESLNALDQLIKHNFIEEKKFGIFTKMKNLTDVHS